MKIKLSKSQWESIGRKAGWSTPGGLMRTVVDQSKDAIQERVDTPEHRLKNLENKKVQLTQEMFQAHTTGDPSKLPELRQNLVNLETEIRAAQEAVKKREMYGD